MPCFEGTPMWVSAPSLVRFSDAAPRGSSELCWLLCPARRHGIQTRAPALPQTTNVKARKGAVCKDEKRHWKGQRVGPSNINRQRF